MRNLFHIYLSLQPFGLSDCSNKEKYATNIIEFLSAWRLLGKVSLYVLTIGIGAACSPAHLDGAASRQISFRAAMTTSLASRSSHECICWNTSCRRDVFIASDLGTCTSGMGKNGSFGRAGTVAGEADEVSARDDVSARDGVSESDGKGDNGHGNGAEPGEPGDTGTNGQGAEADPSNPGGGNGRGSNGRGGNGGGGNGGGGSKR